MPVAYRAVALKRFLVAALAALAAILPRAALAATAPVFDVAAAGLRGRL
jgi:hypothetical protein